MGLADGAAARMAARGGSRRDMCVDMMRLRQMTNTKCYNHK
jgi:hypothetical protein